MLGSPLEQWRTRWLAEEIPQDNEVSVFKRSFREAALEPPAGEARLSSTVDIAQTVEVAAEQRQRLTTVVRST